MTEQVIPPALDGERLDRVVSMLTGLPRSVAGAVVDGEGVRVNGRAVASRTRKVRAGERIDIDMPPPDPGPVAEPEVRVPVVYADDEVIVVDKPAGLVVHPGAGTPRGTLVHGLLALFPDLGDHEWPDEARPGIVHRLDKGTSGLLMVARTPASLIELSRQLQRRSVERRYLALVWGAVEGSSGVVDAPLGRSVADPTRMAVRLDGRRAVTRYEVVGRFVEPRPTTLLSCALETGRTHQIRVHLAAVKHPVVGDARYKGKGGGGELVPSRRPFLHAAVLGFVHPTTGEALRFESPLPEDLRTILDQLAGADPP